MQRDIRAVVVMGVCGCGKSCVGAAMAELCGGRLIEGDAFHPPENIAKMSAGVALTDADRAGWLDALGRELAAALAAGELAILACSALKRAYRDRLRGAAPGLGFVYLALSREQAADRVGRRPGHFMPASLVASQFEALEPPTGEDLVLALDGTAPVAALAASAAAWLRASCEAADASLARGR